MKIGIVELKGGEGGSGGCQECQDARPPTPQPGLMKFYRSSAVRRCVTSSIHDF